jgi:hypothetical protein
MGELKPCQMTADEAISALEMCQALMLFDPMTGETHELCEENKDNQDLYNACSLAIDALRRAQPANEPLTNTGGSFNGTGNVYNGTGPCGNICVGTGGGDSDA